MICTIGGHLVHDKRAYMDPLILGKVPLSQIFTFQTLQGACLPCILPWE
jgi:hypothetical protein